MNYISVLHNPEGVDTQLNKPNQINKQSKKGKLHPRRWSEVNHHVSILFMLDAYMLKYTI